MNASPPALTGTYTKHPPSAPAAAARRQRGDLGLLEDDVGRGVVEVAVDELLAPEGRALRDVVERERL